MPREDQQDPSVHVDDQLLAALALGETDDLGDLPPAEVEEAHAHLAACPRCAEDLAALRETFALATAAPAEQLTAPPPSVWAAISAQIAAESTPTAPATPVAPAAPAIPVAPAASAAQHAPPATAPAEQYAAPIDLASRRRGVPTWLASTAAAVTLFAGLGGGWLIAQSDDPEEAPQATVVSTARLASLDAAADDRGQAEVRRQGDKVVLHVEATELGGPDGIREVWLINLDGSRMVSLGLLARGEAGDFEFPAGLLEEGYQIVDISYEPGDGDPTHSGRSLARGTLDG